MNTVEGLHFDIVGIADINELSADLHDAETIDYLDKAIDQYLQRTNGLAE
jgi:hypothetical protein